MRAATSEDAPGIAALEAQAFDGGAWSEADVLGSLQRAGSLGLVCFQDGQLIAHALGWMLCGEGELLRIAVHPSQRGLGFGGRLLAAFVGHPGVSGADRIFLEVRADNVAARALYASRGFVVVGTRPRYYRDGTDAVLYALFRSPAC